MIYLKKIHLLQHNISNGYQIRIINGKNLKCLKTNYEMLEYDSVLSMMILNC